MDADGGGRYELLGRGSDLGIRVSGPDPVACLAAAIEGLAASLGDPAPGARITREPIQLDGEPVELLVGLLDEAIARLDAEGALAVRLADARIADGRLLAQLESIPLGQVRVRGSPPKAATWHGARLEPSGGGWEGEIMLDL